MVLVQIHKKYDHLRKNDRTDIQNLSREDKEAVLVRF